MLLNSLQCTEQPLITKNYPIQNVNSAEVEYVPALKALLKNKTSGLFINIISTFSGDTQVNF